MNHYDNVLKVYADNGLRTAADWLTQQREIVAESKPCAETTQRGVTVSLYSRAQTRVRAKSERPRILKAKCEPSGAALQ